MRPILRHGNALLRERWTPAHPHPFLPAPHPAFGPAALALDEDGRILECSAAAGDLFDYAAGELYGWHVSLLLPGLAETPLVREGGINSRLAYLSRCCAPFVAARRNGEKFPCELYFNRLGNPEAAPLTVIVRTAGEPVRLHR